MLDGQEGGEGGGDHQRPEDTLEEDGHPKAPRGGVRRALGGGEEVQIVDHEVTGQPHGQGDHCEEVEVPGEEPKGLLQDVPAHQRQWRNCISYSNLNTESG